MLSALIYPTMPMTCKEMCELMSHDDFLIAYSFFCSPLLSYEVSISSASWILFAFALHFCVGCDALYVI